MEMLGPSKSYKIKHLKSDDSRRRGDYAPYAQSNCSRNGFTHHEG